MRPLILLLLVFSVTAPAFAQGLTKEQGDAILEELRNIRNELRELRQQRQPPARQRVAPVAAGKASVSTLGNASQGEADAPLTLVEFTDYQCPFCRRFHEQSYPQLKAEYIDTGKLRYVVRDLPLPFHGDARLAAKAVHCAGEQDRYWAMHHALFTGGSGLKRANLLDYAAEVGADRGVLDACLDSDRYEADIDRDVTDANAASVTGTPSFVLGKTTENVVDGVVIRGAQPYASFKAQIDSLLQAAND